MLTALSGRPLHRYVVLKPSRRPTPPIPHELKPSPPPSCSIPTSSPRTPASSSSWAPGRSRRRAGSICAGSSCRPWRSTAPCHLASPTMPPHRTASPPVPPHNPAPRRRHVLPAAAAGDFPRSEQIGTGGFFLLQKAKLLLFIFKRPDLGHLDKKGDGFRYEVIKNFKPSSSNGGSYRSWSMELINHARPPAILEALSRRSSMGRSIIFWLLAVGCRRR
ncbi:hypothetical protein VPH35_099023 [Triticum aestivum]|uniref:proline-rich receptor-like protein kinase PERK2 n=1 Tax=Triticum aestivum TaxID=4565 RepID=UPI001D028D22|nr:proline-rich receptor-like protein kinase PERK2 [Triticum aestivum]